ncbi:MAG TPA: HNH endonuclease [Acidobacteria bacterium]|nr:HNH endonuclease [Acidobacteriota bacterium]
MLHDRAGPVLDVGRKTRTIPPAIRRALASRDRHGCFPGCESRHCDAHHVRHWADGGATRLNNLVLLCRRHHRAVHEAGFAVALEEDDEVRFTHPGGWPLVPAPTAPQWTWAALSPTAARTSARGAIQ